MQFNLTDETDMMAVSPINLEARRSMIKFLASSGALALSGCAVPQPKGKGQMLTGGGNKAPIKGVAMVFSLSPLIFGEKNNSASAYYGGAFRAQVQDKFVATLRHNGLPVSKLYLQDGGGVSIQNAEQRWPDEFRVGSQLSQMLTIYESKAEIRTFSRPGSVQDVYVVDYRAILWDMETRKPFWWSGIEHIVNPHGRTERNVESLAMHLLKNIQSSALLKLRFEEIMSVEGYRLPRAI
jgi:hypothetical protein